MPKPRSVTLQTIADECGVSRTTVSNAFSRPDQLSDELRSRVLHTADRLGYTGPHPGARSLRKGRAGALGVVLKESLAYALNDSHAIEFLGGLAESTQDPPMALALIPAGPIDSGTTSAIADALVDGFCLFSLPDGHPAIESALARRLPTVFVDGPRLPDHSFVGIDDTAAMREMTEAIINAGHHDIVALTFRLLPDDYIGPVDDERIDRTAFAVTRNRLRGFTNAVQARSLTPRIYEVGVNTRLAAKSAASQVLCSSSPPTALVCVSDEIALGALEAAREIGLDVPKHLTVTGFDDIPEAAQANLATVRQSAAEKGRVAARLATTDTTETVILPHEFVARRSLGPPPS